MGHKESDMTEWLSLHFFIFNFFCHFVYSISGCNLLWTGPVLYSLCFLNLDACFFFQVKEVFSYYILKYVLFPVFSLSSFLDLYKVVIIMLLRSSLNLNVDVVPEVSLTVLTYFHSFFFFYSALMISTFLSSSMLICSSVSSNLLLICQEKYQ